MPAPASRRSTAVALALIAAALGGNGVVTLVWSAYRDRLEAAIGAMAYGSAPSDLGRQWAHASLIIGAAVGLLWALAMALVIVALAWRWRWGATGSMVLAVLLLGWTPPMTIAYLFVPPRFLVPPASLAWLPDGVAAPASSAALLLMAIGGAIVLANGLRAATR